MAEKLSYKYLQSLKKSIDLTFIESGPVIFKSLEDEQRNIYSHVYRWIMNLM